MFKLFYQRIKPTKQALFMVNPAIIQKSLKNLQRSIGHYFESFTNTNEVCNPKKCLIILVTSFFLFLITIDI